MRVAYLQTAPSGYMDACLAALVNEQGASLFVTVPRGHPDAPYAETQVPAERRYPMESFDPDPHLVDALRRFAPDITMVVSWHHPAYRRCLRSMSSSLRILCMDNPWRATLRQRLGVAVAPRYIAPLYEMAFLPGDRQREFARRLGFADDRIMTGLYAADTSLFRPTRPLRHPDRRRFVFSGRLVPEKGVDTLLDAYRRYRDSVAQPWELMVAGTGRMAQQIESVEGVVSLGFVQPDALPTVLDQGRFLVLPSTFEPWGVVVHEATSSGLGVICSEHVGAGDHLVDARNGWVVPAGRPDALASAMCRAHAVDDAGLDVIERASVELAAAYSPSRWAATVVQSIERARAI